MTGEQITRRQLADQLLRCARYDGRTLDPQTFEDWFTLLGHLPADDVEAAVTEHYQESEKWIMPANIVSFCKQRTAARAIEAVRQAPPVCWGPGCDVRYVLSARDGSTFAFPDDKHAPDCRAMQGVLVFDPRGPSWGVMPVDPGEFDEVEWEAGLKAAAGQMYKFSVLDEGLDGEPAAIEDGR